MPTKLAGCTQDEYMNDTTNGSQSAVRLFAFNGSECHTRCVVMTYWPFGWMAR